MLMEACQLLLYKPMQHVDPVMARSFSQLAEVAVKKHNLERDSLLVSPRENIIS